MPSPLVLFGFKCISMALNLLCNSNSIRKFLSVLTLIYPENGSSYSMQNNQPKSTNASLSFILAVYKSSLSL